MRATGAILAGRNTYDVGGRNSEGPASAAYGGAWSGRIFVLTDRVPPGPTDPAVTFLSGDVEAAVATGLQAADGKNLEIFGADVVAQCLTKERGLVDEILVHVVPVPLGQGVRFFSAPEATKISLEPVGTTRSGVVTTLHFRVNR
jgi:dihydrofolate reductase